MTSFTLAQAEKEAAMADSYTRILVLMDCFRFRKMARLDRYALLGGWWSACDNVWRLRGIIRQELRDATREELDAMMEPAELAALALMPERFTVYRGCYPLNRPGLSWSLDRDIAARFPYLDRYSGPARRYGQTPILRTGTIARSRAVLKLDRNEREIIAHYVHVTGEVALEPAPVAQPGAVSPQ
jgi:hypothetical protein